MTYEEAENRLCVCYGCKYLTGENECLGDSNCFEAKKLAIESLKKQIPKKPTVEWEDNKGLPDYYCPECHSLVADFIGRNFVKEHHCQCGQAIDWSEEEE